MWSKKKIKKIYQEQTANINIYPNYLDRSNLFNKLKYDKIILKNDEDTLDFLPKILINTHTDRLSNMYEKIEHELSDTPMSNIQLLVEKNFFGLDKRGSYNFRYPYFVNTGYSESMFDDIFLSNEIQAIYLIYSDIEWIHHYGKHGFNYVLKQAGKIEYILNTEFKKHNLLCKSFELNPNYYAYAAGLNINKFLITNIIIVKENLNAI